MFDLVQRASSLACICFFGVRQVGDCLMVTDSGGRKRYLIGYLDDGSVFWERAKEYDEVTNEIFA
jgi:hypothetical protein